MGERVRGCGGEINVKESVNEEISKEKIGTKFYPIAVIGILYYFLS
jgi:hypothetical protein